MIVWLKRISLGGSEYQGDAMRLVEAMMVGFTRSGDGQEWDTRPEAEIPRYRVTCIGYIRAFN